MSQDMSQEEKELPVVHANVCFSIDVECPHCGEYVDVKDEVIEYLEPGLSASDMEKQVECPFCGQDFIVDSVS